MPTPTKTQAAPPGTDTLSRREARIKELTAAAELQKEPRGGVPTGHHFLAGSPISIADAERRAPATPSQQPPGVVELDHGTRNQNEALRSDLCPIRVSYSTPAFDFELPYRMAVDAIVGNFVRFEPVRPHLTTFTWTLIRAPKGSRANLASAQLTPDVPGLYVVEAVIGGGWTREILVAAFPRSTEDQMVFPPHMGLQRRKRLRAILRDSNVTAQRIVDALERGPTADFRALLGITGDAPFNPTIFGG